MGKLTATNAKAAKDERIKRRKSEEPSGVVI
jgi:hypothetical protein